MDIRQLFLDRHAAVHSRAMNADGWWKEEDIIWDEVDAISQAIDLAALRDYRAAVGRTTQAWASTLDFNRLDKLVAADEAQRAIARGDFGHQGTWVGPYWAKVVWTHTSFLFWLAVEHNWYHVGEIWVLRSLLKQPGY